MLEYYFYQTPCSISGPHRQYQTTLTFSFDKKTKIYRLTFCRYALLRELRFIECVLHKCYWYRDCITMKSRLQNPFYWVHSTALNWSKGNITETLLPRLCQNVSQCRGLLPTTLKWLIKMPQLWKAPKGTMWPHYNSEEALPPSPEIVLNRKLESQNTLPRIGDHFEV